MDLPVFDIEIARAAYAHISHRPDQRADAERAAYDDHIAAVIEALRPIAVSEAQTAVMRAGVEAYAGGYLTRLYAVLGARGRTASVMVTGPARFPTARNRKALAAEANRESELETWSRREQRRLRDAILAARTPEQTSDDAYRRLRAAIARDVATVRAIDAGESPFARQAFTAGAARMLRAAANHGHGEAVRRVLAELRADDARRGKPFFAATNGIWRLAEAAGTARAGIDAELIRRPP